MATYRKSICTRTRTRVCSRRMLKLISSSLLLMLWVCAACYLVIISLEKRSGDRATTRSNAAHADSKASRVHDEVALDGPAVVRIRRRIRLLNARQTIYNEDAYFGPLTNDSVVIVVRVRPDDRSTYLPDVIDALAATKGIENSLLVFSHDEYEEDDAAAATTTETETRFDATPRVDFCRVLHTYYPYSIRTHPNAFPNHAPSDCAPDTVPEEAVRTNCSNAVRPDRFGRYREAAFAQTKHRWWWTMNRVFDQLDATKAFAGNFVFLEDDQYVVPDFIHTLRLMELVRPSRCSDTDTDCRILSLGSSLSAVDVDFAANSGRAVEFAATATATAAAAAVYDDWQNVGMVLRRSVWQRIKACAEVFCTHDDYRWHRSFLAASQKCLASELKAVVLLAPRVYHIGECDLRSTDVRECTTSPLSTVRAMLKASEDYFFPEELFVVTARSIDDGQPSSGAKREKLSPNGGWSDVRDHKLCLGMATSANNALHRPF